MKDDIEIMFREDGTAYSITIHNECPELPEIGVRVKGGFMRISSDVERCEIRSKVSPITVAVWMLTQEYRKPNFRAS